MDELLKALLILTNYCINKDNCKECVLQSMCGKIIQDWY